MRRARGPLGWLILADRPLGWHRWRWWRWWRRHVHPWTDAPAQAGLATGSGAPIVAGVVFVSERESGAQGWISCASCSAAMLAGWAEREPSPHLNDAHRIREGAGLAHAGGMTDADLARGLEAVYGTAGSTVSPTKAAVLAALDEGRGLLWMHTYGRLPEQLRRWSPSFTGGHCAFIAGRRSSSSDLVGWFDPLATDGWSGEWVDVDVLLAADWGDPARSYVRSTSSGGDDVVGLSYTILEAAAGTAVVKGDAAHSYIRVEDGSTVAIAAGSAKATYLSVNVTAPVAYGHAYLIGESAALLLAKDVDWTAAPVPPAGEYEDGYAQGSADQWATWADGLGVPRPPEPPAASG